MNKLESEEMKREQNDLKQWVNTKAIVSNPDHKIDPNDNDEKEEDIIDVPAIRKSNVIEIGHSEWDYITPIRQNTKPPEFARKTLINQTQNKAVAEIEKISEITPIFLCDKGTKYFMNGDYESAISAFDEAINLDKDYLEAYCNKIQCYIASKAVFDKEELLQNIDKIESILETLEREKMDNMMNEIEMKKDKMNVRDTANIIARLQKGIIQSLGVLDQLRTKQNIDDEILILIKMTLEKGRKLFEIHKKLKNLQNEFGLFRDATIFEGLQKEAMRYLNVIKIISMKQTANKLINNEKYMDGIEKYSEALMMINNCRDTEVDECSLLEWQCLNNRSAANFKSKQFAECIKDCDQMIESKYSEDWHKALVRRGACSLSLWKLDQNNQDYLQRCFKDYTEASKHDDTYQLYASKIESLLARSGQR